MATRILALGSFLLTILLSFTPGSGEQSFTEEASSDFIPWSGYWWPLRYGGLATGMDYRGHPAPLEKYELYLYGSYPLGATRWELKNHYKPDALPWEGLCHGRAFAAAYEPMDFKPSSLRNVAFRLEDKRGLMVAAHTDDLLDRALDSGPAEFHRFLMKYIKEGRKPIVADLDPSEEVWFYPIFKYHLTVEGNSQRWDVVCKVWYSDIVSPDTPGPVIGSKTYTYRLYLQEGAIVGGEWTGQSITDHPSRIYAPLAPRASNPYVDYATVKAIALSKDDFLEGQQWLGPGCYELVLLDPDPYLLPVEKGGSLELLFRNDDPQLGPIKVDLKDAEERPLKEWTVLQGLSVSITAENPPLRLTLTRDDYGNGGTYGLCLDFPSAHQYTIPWVYKGGAWRGLAVVNPNQEEARVWVSSYAEDGTPVRTLFGPVILPPGHKVAFLLNGLEFPSDQVKMTQLMVFSDKPVTGVYLQGLFGENLVGWPLRPANWRKAVIPELGGTWGIVNAGLSSKRVKVGFFGQGRALGWAEYQLEPRSAVRRGTDYAEWVLLEAEGEIEGYAEWVKGAYFRHDSILALAEIGKKFFVPHVADDGFWRTSLTLINLKELNNRILLTLHGPFGKTQTELILGPYQKKAFYLQGLFPSMGAFLWQSALVIEAEEDITGYFCYESPESISSLPLVTTGGKKELIIPHIADDGYWWTGIALFNPHTREIGLRIIAYDHRGEKLGEVSRKMAPGQKWAFLTTGVIPQGTSWVKLLADEPICGFYLFGGAGAEVLSGGIIH